ncbi:MAG TPA: hypothetical protein VK447_04485, partial [Myxococcaceae bacterium]|nr:hypothetical protein [Myxococcaceae bacterium]
PISGPGGTPGPGTPAGGNSGAPPTPAWEGEFWKNASPDARAMYSSLKASGVQVTQDEANKLSGMGPQESARFMAGKLANAPGDVSPLVEQQFMSMLSPEERASYRMQRSITQQNNAMKELMGSLDTGGLPSQREHQLLGLLDASQRAQYQLAKAARATGTPAANGASIDNAAQAARELANAFGRVAVMNSNGGPKTPPQQAQYAADMAKLSPAQQQLVSQVTDLRSRYAAQHAFQKGNDSFLLALDTLKHAGPDSGVTRSVFAQTMPLLDPAQRNQLQQLQQEARDQASGGANNGGQTALLQAISQIFSSLARLLQSQVDAGRRRPIVG